jgi:hypothetical protein
MSTLSAFDDRVANSMELGKQVLSCETVCSGVLAWAWALEILGYQAPLEGRGLSSGIAQV